jgi:hypothetical protein
MPVISASRIACTALGLEPVGVPWTGEDTHCALDGSPIRMGDRVMPLAFGNGFTDDASVIRTSALISGYTAALLSKATMLKTQKVVVSERDGAFPIASLPARAWFLRYPPATPFVAVLSDSMLQHLIWRTRVTLDPDLISLRIGAREWLIRRPRIIDLADTILARGGTAALPLYVDPNLSDPSHCRPLSGRTPAELAEWSGLTQAEVWAVATLVRAGDDFARPDRFTL